VYFAYECSIMQHGIVFWGGSEAALSKVFVAQKRLVRALAGVRFWPGPTPLCSARPLFAQLDLLPVFSIYLLECCKFVRKFPHHFKRTKDVHVYENRGKSELYVCVQNLAISRQNPLSCCPKLYNLLPVSIRAEHIFSRFETALKTFMGQRKFYTFEEYSDYMKNL